MWKVQFDLTSPSPMSLDFVINDIRVRVIENFAQITADNIQAVNHNAAHTKALYAATCCVNYLCWKYDAVLSINSGRLNIEEIGPEGKTISHAGYGSVGMWPTMVVADRPQSLNSVSGKKSDAASYYRKGCLSTDSFDQFQNFYSAVENISKKIYKKQPGEPEKIELDRALTECFGGKLQSLEVIAKAEPTFNTHEPTISKVTRILYKAYRCQLNHPKDYQGKKVLFDTLDEIEVMNALPLVKFVAKALLGYEESSL
jgi:hypothetical protein